LDTGEILPPVWKGVDISGRYRWAEQNPRVNQKEEDEYVAMEFVFDEYNMRDLSPSKRFAKIMEVMGDVNEMDESKRWDCVWLLGETYEDDITNEFKRKIEELMVTILYMDNNAIVRHEAAFQIGLHNMRSKIPDLITTIKLDSSDLVKHEALESLGLLRVKDQPSLDVLNWMCHNKSDVVCDTAKFVLKRLERLKGRGEYHGEAIV